MTRPTLQRRLICLSVLLAVTSATSEEQKTRWSRQISSYTSDISDWVPLSGPVEKEQPDKAELPPIRRQAVAEPRILAEPFPGFSRPTGFSQDAFPSRAFFQSPPNRQLYLHSVPSVPSAPQNYLQDQGFGQSIRFGLTQPNFPLSQGFISNQFPYEGIPSTKTLPQSIIKNPVKFESFPNSNLPLSPQAKPFVGQIQHIPPETQKFVDGYRLANDSFALKKKPQSLLKLKYENIEKNPIPASGSILREPDTKSKVEREEVQLLYVPVESLNRGQFGSRNPSQTQIQHQFVNTDVYSQSLPSQKVKQVFTNDFQRPLIKPSQNYNFAQKYNTNVNPQSQELDQTPNFSTIIPPFPSLSPTTTKPKKLKPHQPPLAVFLAQEAKKSDQIKVGDVLFSLKNTNTIAVLDSVNPLNAPTVFIGPSSLTPPENFVKFDLPYLSNIENIEKKLKQLPFFVAPLSYKTPEGFAKIPFPPPHVGSVVINSLIKETQTTNATPIPSSYSRSTSLPKQENSYATQKPSIAYFSTSPPKTPISQISSINQPSNYYSFEPQSVTSLKPSQELEGIIASPPKTGSYFLSDVNDFYNPSQYVKFPSSNNYISSEPANAFNILKSVETTTTPKITTTTSRSTTTNQPSTYSNQLLETHNPYSINQAFQLSTPIEYQNYFDEYKEFATPISGPQTTVSSNRISLVEQPPKFEKTTESQRVTEKQSDQKLQGNYLQNYTPEIQYESEIQHSHYANVEPDSHSIRLTSNSQYFPTASTTKSNDDISDINVSPTLEYNVNIEKQSPFVNENTETSYIAPDVSTQIKESTYEYEQYGNANFFDENKYVASITTTSTTTKKTPLRNRGRPRHTTLRSEANEATTRTTITRKPLRERKPLPYRTRNDSSRTSTERSTTFSDHSEITLKTTKSKTRGRIHYQHSDADDVHEKPNKGDGSRVEDLAYQRDILHQNYPVTLTERMSTLEMETVTEPLPKLSTKAVNELYNKASAYLNEKVDSSQRDKSDTINTESKEENRKYKLLTENQTEATFSSDLSLTQNKENTHSSRSSEAPSDSLSYSDRPTSKINVEVEQVSPESNIENTSGMNLVTELVNTLNTNVPVDSVEINENFEKFKITIKPDIENTGIDINSYNSKQDITKESFEEKSVQTTPSYNRIRVRPGVIKKYHQTTSTEIPKSKIERNRPGQTVTYRPAFDKRRTTMRIEEIQTDLKTKQIHGRYESQDYKHPVYKPDPTTATSIISSNPDETSTKRSHYRRRRPNTVTSTSTESTNYSKGAYEAKTRLRNRRPTEKTRERLDSSTENIASTLKNTPHKYTPRPRLSERYSQKPDTEDKEDQDSNYSINIPHFATLENEQWSPKISTQSFKPYNPNVISENDNTVTPGRRSNGFGILEPDIITARNEYDNILISVTPASNRVDKKIPDIPPTLEALVEQSKITKSDSGDTMSTFESMLEEVMKSLEEQDEDEYTVNVMKHKGGEIGEIPPEKVISSEENYSSKLPTTLDPEITTVMSTAADSTFEEQKETDKHKRRRGFWKKVNVRPLTTESIEVAESQFYGNIINRNGEPVNPSKITHSKKVKETEKPTVLVTTYKPKLKFRKETLNSQTESDNMQYNVDIPNTINKILENNLNKTKKSTTQTIDTVNAYDIQTEQPDLRPEDLDLGTGSPKSTMNYFYNTSTEPVTKLPIDRSDSFGFMEYLLGLTSGADETKTSNLIEITTENNAENIDNIDITTSTDISYLKGGTTESSYIPDEITSLPVTEDIIEETTKIMEIRKLNGTVQEKEALNVDETSKSEAKIERSTVSSFMDLIGVVSTSMSTEISHETEICFRGKCMKTNKVFL